MMADAIHRGAGQVILVLFIIIIIHVLLLLLLPFVYSYAHSYSFDDDSGQIMPMTRRAMYGSILMGGASLLEPFSMIRLDVSGEVHHHHCIITAPSLYRHTV